GKIVIAGSFGSYNGTPRGHIARVRNNGSLDPTFNPGTGANGNIRAIALQSDGGIVVAGDFTLFDGADRFGLARLNSDGSLDVILIAVDFTHIGARGRSRIARLLPDGSLDPNLDPGFGPDNSVYALALQSDGKPLLGGLFTSYNGTRRIGLARLKYDGSLDTS